MLGDPLLCMAAVAHNPDTEDSSSPCLLFLDAQENKFTGRDYFPCNKPLEATDSQSLCDCYAWTENNIHLPARWAMMSATAGTEVKATVIVPKSPMARLEKAAALGSVTRSKAVAMAEELPPSVTPRVM